MTGNQPYDAHSRDTVDRDPWLGCVVGQRYRIEQRIGQGGMGVVYRGQHLELGKRVAIKRLDPSIVGDPDSFARFRREAVAASRIESPHVVHVFDWGKADDGSPYLVMELLEGCDLRELFRREGRLLAEQAAAVMGQVLRALIRTHEAQILHRDLKPENIFLCNYGSDELYVKLLDFGISKQLVEAAPENQVTKRGVILGTASYMSPEQARGDSTLDVRSDIYGVGAILYEALTGQVPHRARTYEATLVAICTRDAEDVRLLAPLVPEVLAGAVAKALKRDPNERFGSAREFLDALTLAVPDLNTRLSEPVPHGVDPAHPDWVTGPRRRWRARVYLIVAAILVATAAATYLTHRRHLAPPRDASLAVPDQRPSPSVTVSPRGQPEPEPQPQPQPSGPHAAEGTPQVTPSARARSATEPSPSAAATRAPGARHGPATTPPGIGPTDAPGVASDLKLRRTMP